MAFEKIQSCGWKGEAVPKITGGDFMLSKGTVYNLGSEIKAFGERMAHVKLFDFPLFRWCCGPVIRLGYIVMDYAYNGPIGDMKQ